MEGHAARENFHAFSFRSTLGRMRDPHREPADHLGSCSAKSFLWVALLAVAAGAAIIIELVFVDFVHGNSHRTGERHRNDVVVSSNSWFDRDHWNVSRFCSPAVCPSYFDGCLSTPF
jgi:hypothetical protein